MPLDFKKLTWFAATFAALATFTVYLPALHNGFVNWDDGVYVYDNKDIQSMDFRLLVWIFTPEANATWHPLTMFSLALDYTIWGLNPLGYHFTNILFHTANTFLVFILVVRLIECKTITNTTPAPSLFNKEGAGWRYPLVAASVTALLFGIHPLHVESVAWISERKDVLYAFFFLSSLLAYLKYVSAVSSRRSVFYVICLTSFFLALLSKPMAVSLPLVLLILDFYPFRRLTTAGGVLREKIPFLVLSLLASLITIWVQRVGGALAPLEEYPFAERILIAVRALAFYLSKMILPSGLAPYYPHPVEIDLFAIEYIGSFISIILITILSILSLKRFRLFSAVWLYYIVTLIPVIGIVKVGSHSMADRYTYLPSLGLFLLFGAGIGHIFARSSKKKQAALVAALTFLFGTLTNKTTTQIYVWKNPITLWSRVIKYFQYSTKAYINRGGAYVGLGDYQQAIKDLDTAIRLNPMSLDAHIARGNAYNRFGDYQQAIKDYSKAIELALLESEDRKQATDIYINRGSTYMSMGEYLLSIKDFNEAIKLNPGYAKAYNLRGAVYVNTGDYRQAIKTFNTAIELDPLSADVYYNRGTVYRILGDNHKAINDFSRAISLNPQYAEAYNNRGNAYRDLGKHRQSVEDYSIAIKLNPQDAIAYRNRGIAYRNLNNREQAIKDFQRADEMRRR